MHQLLCDMGLWGIPCEARGGSSTFITWTYVDVFIYDKPFRAKSNTVDAAN